MDIISFVTDNALEVIPVLYIIGMIIKGTEKIQDKYIPVILLVIGIVSCIFLLGLKISSVFQGVLVTGAAVYTNQLIKQGKKKE